MKHIQYTEAIQRSTGTGEGESVFPASSVKDREKGKKYQSDSLQVHRIYTLPWPINHAQRLLPEDRNRFLGLPIPVLPP